MVNFPSLLALSVSALLAAASVVPVKREPDHPAPVAREPEHPLHLAKRDAAGRQTRHLRPVYDNTKREITLPDVGQVATFPPTGIPQPIRGPYGDVRSGGTNEEIDRQNPDYVAPPLSDNGLPISSFSVFNLIRLCRQYSQFEVAFFALSHPPIRWRLDTGTDRQGPATLCVALQSNCDPRYLTRFTAKEISAAEIRLAPNAYRELYGRSFFFYLFTHTRTLQTLAPCRRVGNSFRR